jgi:hypothetical protein
MQTTLGTSVRLVSLQFSFSNPDVVPECVKKLPRETQEEASARKTMPIPGQAIIQPTEDVSLVEIPGMLEKAGYELVDAFYKPRIDQKTKKTYHMVRFVFAHHAHVSLSPEFKSVRDRIRLALDGICTQAMWRTRSFLNPFYKDGERVEDQYAMSLNFEVRKPLFLPDGQPVVMWEKDAQGKRTGTAPVPLKARLNLVVEDQTIALK